MKTWFLKFFGVLGEYLRAVFARGVDDQLNMLLPLALDVVARVATQFELVTSEEKRQAALHTLLREVNLRGIRAATSTLNFALELAVQKLKADQGE